MADPSLLIFNDWKTDLYPYIGKAFEVAYAERMNKLSPIIGEVTNKNTVDYELTGSGGYGEPQVYDGLNLNMGTLLRAFKTRITPQEYNLTATVGYKEAKIEKMGITRKVGRSLGDGMAMKVYMECLRMFGGAFDSTKVGGDGVCWANAAHPVAADSSEQASRSHKAKSEAGTFSNLITDVLSVSAITAAQSKANRFVTPDGMPFLCDMDTLLVSPELEAEAKKICGEDAKLYPDQSDHVNPCRDMQYIVIGGGNVGFTATQWAVCDRRLMKEIVNIVYNTKPMVLQNKLDNPLITQFLSYSDFGVGWGDARQIIFSTGAGTSGG